SLRTQLSLNTCNFVVALTDSIGKEFEIFVESSFVNLLKLCGLTKKIVSNAGCNALKKIIENTQSVKAVNLITVAMGDKNATLRLKATELLTCCLENCEVNQLGRNLEIIDKAIRKVVSDASSDVRGAAKELFNIYSDKFPAKADE
ncbi:hypothetical protein ROZALSC1DRAFT_13120, partial [Rozella allomycis CSF55]